MFSLLDARQTFLDQGRALPTHQQATASQCVHDPVTVAQMAADQRQRIIG